MSNNNTLDFGYLWFVGDEVSPPDDDWNHRKGASKRGIIGYLITQEAKQTSTNCTEHFSMQKSYTINLFFSERSNLLLTTYHHYLTSLKTKTNRPHRFRDRCQKCLAFRDVGASLEAAKNFSRPGWRSPKKEASNGLLKMGLVHVGGFGFEGHEWEHEMMSRWWQLKYFLFSPRTLGKMNPFWLIFFNGVETTN